MICSKRCQLFLPLSVGTQAAARAMSQGKVPVFQIVRRPPSGDLMILISSAPGSPPVPALLPGHVPPVLAATPITTSQTRRHCSFEH
jgi:hypothetical protein